MGPWKGIKSGQILPNISKFYHKKRKGRGKTKKAESSLEIIIIDDDDSNDDDNVEVVDAPPRSAVLMDLSGKYTKESTIQVLR